MLQSSMLSSPALMPAKIYRSNIPSVPVIEESVFSFLFNPKNSTYPPETAAYIAAETGYTLSRQAVKDLSLSLAWGLRNMTLIPSTFSSNSTSSTLSPLVRGDVIMIFSPNSMSWPVMLFGAVAAGLRLTLASSSSTSRELTWQYVDSKARIVCVAPSLVKVVERMFHELGVSPGEARRRTWIMDQLERGRPRNTKTLIRGYSHISQLMGLGSLESEERFDGVEADETVYICYSSGTTGQPKGVETTHKNLTTVLNMTRSVYFPIHGVDVGLSMLPFYHSFGLVMLIHLPFFSGTSSVVQSAAFCPTKFCQYVEKYQITTAYVVPPMLLALSVHPAVDKNAVKTLTIVVSGAAHLPEALAKNFLRRFADRGAQISLLQGCGSTETTCPAQLVAPGDSVRKFGSVGQLLPNVEARIVDEDEKGGVYDVKEGESGEVWLRAPTIMKGYLGNEAATKASFTDDNWYKTGDIMRRDKDGYMYIVDRKKELIKYKGFQVPPAELEAVLATNPDIADAGVIGIMDQIDGNEVPRAYVVPTNRDVLSNPGLRRTFESSIEEWIKGEVSSHKYLRGGVFAIAEIPKSPTGKILRKVLRERAKAEARRQAKL